MAGAIMKLVLPLATLLAGAGAGGGAAVATRHFLGPPPPAGPVEVETSFVPAAKIIAPLVFDDGRLAGYVAFDTELEVAVDAAPSVTAKLPLLLHAINMRTYHTPLAAGPDGMLPDLGRLRGVVTEAAVEAFGRNVVRKVAITRAVPA